MPSFRFLHAADLHLGSPFRGLALKDAGVARRFAEATRTAFVTLIGRAIEEKVDFAIIAGDIYDGEWRDNAIGLFFNREIARLDRAGIPLFVLKGNHDAESVVTKSVTLPESVRQFSTRKPEMFRLEALRVVLHGQGFADRAVTENLALGYPAPVPGWFNIGVLHTSLSGRPPHANYAPCSIEELRNRGYDYWALGHVHEFEIVADDPPMVFPGNLQGRNIRETGPKGAVIVTVGDSRVTAIERLVVDEARWAAAALELGGVADLAGLLAQAEVAMAKLVADAGGRPLALRLELRGETPLRPWLMANRGAAFDELQGAAHRVHAEIWLEKLELRLAVSPVVAAPNAALAIDLEGLLGAAANDPELHEIAVGLVREIAAKLPGGLGAAQALDEDVVALLAEAREVVLQRALVER